MGFSMTTAVRQRPVIHFTAERGWINDPYGIRWVDGQYHLFFQAIPGRVTWAPNCHWGHATSPDLVHWTEQPLALVPQEFELGCWSGSVVTDDVPKPVIFYTRIAGDDWGQGKVAVARSDGQLWHWSTDRDAVVVDGPPAGLGVHSFRDPFVFRDGEDWLMILAAGFNDGSGGALQYRSRDLDSWTYDGVLCSRLSTSDDEVWTGALWECPQLLHVDRRWVLLISVWDADTLHYVAGAVGDYDGRKFSPRSWQRLTYGNSAYAMTGFIDRDGRPCVMSWLREEPQNNPHLIQRAGAHSIAATLNLDDQDRISLQPHPNLGAHRAALTLSALGDGRSLPIPLEGIPIEAEIRVRPGRIAEILNGEVSIATISADDDGARLRIERDGYENQYVPVSAHRPDVRILVDADLLEIFTVTGYGAFRTRPQRHDGGAHLALTFADDLRVWCYPAPLARANPSLG